MSNNDSSNKIKVFMQDQEIKSIIVTNTNWWGKVYASWSTTIQVWAKWVIWYNGDFGKKYLDLYDPELWDVKSLKWKKWLIMVFEDMFTEFMLYLKLQAGIYQKQLEVISI